MNNALGAIGDFIQKIFQKSINHGNGAKSLEDSVSHIKQYRVKT